MPLLCYLSARVGLHAYFRPRPTYEMVTAEVGLPGELNVDSFTKFH